MKATFSRYCALCVCAAAAMLAGCGGSAQLPSPMVQTPLGSERTVNRVASSGSMAKVAERSHYTKTILYSFRERKRRHRPIRASALPGRRVLWRDRRRRRHERMLQSGSGMRYDLQVGAFR